MKDKLFIDTNILIYLLNEASEFHSEVKKQFVQRLNTYELWISRQIIREFLVVLSRERYVEHYAPLSQLVADVKRIQKYFKIADETELVTEKLYFLLDSYIVGGKNIHDANIVATMLTHDIPKIWTFNKKDFKRYQEITILED